MYKIQIRLDNETMKALCRFASKEYRETRVQAALLIRIELERLGYLEVSSTNEQDTKINESISRPIK